MRHPRLAAVCVLCSYAGIGLVRGLVPPFAAWVLIWSLASRQDHQLPQRLTFATSLTTGLLLVVAEVTRPGIGAVTLLVAITALVTLAGVLVRSERGRVEAVGRRATTDERLRIARDLHDLVGHGLSAIAVQSSTARLALAAGDTETAGTALSAVETSSRVALREMRQMVGLLSDGGTADPISEVGTAGKAPSPGLDDIPALVENIRAGGVAVRFEQTRLWDGASHAVQLCAYRIVQEGLTNAIRHAPGALVSVRLEADDADGRISVTTAGTEANPSRLTSGGRGLEGLRTRVAGLSGEFSSGPTADGWVIEARLPLREEDR